MQGIYKTQKGNFVIVNADGTATNWNTKEKNKVSQIPTNWTPVSREEFAKIAQAEAQAEYTDENSETPGLFEPGSTSNEVGRFAVSMLSPLQSARAEKLEKEGKEYRTWENAPGNIAAGAGDAALLLFSPLRMAGAIGKTLLPKMPDKIAKLAPAIGNAVDKVKTKIGTTGQKVVSATVGAADNVANAEATMAGEEYFGDYDHDFEDHAVADVASGAVGGLMGARRYTKSLNARGELIKNVPRDIRLNERAKAQNFYGDAPVDELGLGYAKKQQDIIDRTQTIFNKDPNVSLGEAIAKNQQELLKLPKPEFNGTGIRVGFNSEPKARNMQTNVSDKINAYKTHLLNDMELKGLLKVGHPKGGFKYMVPLEKLDEAFEYLNNTINWNKNIQGQARSAADEKAAREIYSELRQGLERSSEIEKKFGGGDEISQVDKYKKDYSEKLLDGDILAGITGKGNARLERTGDYFPFRGFDPYDPRNYWALERLAELGTVRGTAVMPNKIEDN